ncbi:hypothetical protein Hanom_Chr07g00667371 [Helianthus anomalus]
MSIQAKPTNFSQNQTGRTVQMLNKKTSNRAERVLPLAHNASTYSRCLISE